MRSVRIIITGEVQGVGFRNFIKQTARRYNLTGWVRNVGIDMLEILFQGENKSLEQSYCPSAIWALITQLSSSVDVEAEEITD